MSFERKYDWSMLNCKKWEIEVKKWSSKLLNSKSSWFEISQLKLKAQSIIAKFTLLSLNMWPSHLSSLSSPHGLKLMYWWLKTSQESKFKLISLVRFTMTTIFWRVLTFWKILKTKILELCTVKLVIRQLDSKMRWAFIVLIQLKIRSFLKLELFTVRKKLLRMTCT